MIQPMIEEVDSINWYEPRMSIEKDKAAIAIINKWIVRSIYL
ncbi:MAG: hypothetical protein ABI237_07205 [Ginsengibacter sp.]